MATSDIADRRRYGVLVRVGLSYRLVGWWAAFSAAQAWQTTYHAAHRAESAILVKDGPKISNCSPINWGGRDAASPERIYGYGVDQVSPATFARLLASR